MIVSGRENATHLWDNVKNREHCVLHIQRERYDSMIRHVLIGQMCRWHSSLSSSTREREKGRKNNLKFRERPVGELIREIRKRARDLIANTNPRLWFSNVQQNYNKNVFLHVIPFEWLNLKKKQLKKQSKNMCAQFRHVCCELRVLFLFSYETAAKFVQSIIACVENFTCHYTRSSRKNKMLMAAIQWMNEFGNIFTVADATAAWVYVRAPNT